MSLYSYWSKIKAKAKDTLCLSRQNKKAPIEQWKWKGLFENKGICLAPESLFLNKPVNPEPCNKLITDMLRLIPKDFLIKMV